jgi:hypothetical protein
VKVLRSDDNNILTDCNSPPAFTMDCFHDFCLACDRESTSGPYCSQACRLADLEKASPPQSPTYPSSSPQSTVSSRLGSGSGFVLAPPYKFPQRATGSRSASSEASRPQSSSTDSIRKTQQQQRSLTPSSSRSSLSSNMSLSSGTIISEQARQELQEYFDYFAASRASKRRTSTH